MNMSTADLEWPFGVRKFVPRDDTSLLPRDISRLAGVHPELCRVVELARESFSFIVVEGVRTKERQRELFARKATLTMNSKHLTGHAVDLAPWNDKNKNGIVNTDEIDWNDRNAFNLMARAVMDAAVTLNFSIRWGGNFRDANGRPWYDGPHFEVASTGR